MTELEYVIANFAERLAAFREKRIVLHGSRNYAEAIIENFADSFNFIGIMSLDPIEGDFFHGLKVLLEEELPELDVDVIILTERVKYAVNAFYSIRRVCNAYKIAINNKYGLDEFALHREAENNVSRMTLEKAKEKCNGYDIIAFEVINTVLYAPHISDILARRLFCNLIEDLRVEKKEIIFSLQKSFPAEIQIEELNGFGLLHDEKKEIMYREGEDHSFRRLRESNPGKKILYFGSRLAYDFILPRCYGIDTCRFIETYNPENLISRQRKHKIAHSFDPDLRDNIKKQIQTKQLISFDIFDTLLIRKTLYPRDVFFLTERKALSEGYNVKDFVSARVRAEENQSFCTIYQIYDWLCEYFGWNEETGLKILEIELNTEREMLIPRTEVVDLLNFAKKEGKRIVLTSDMYLPESNLRSLLSEKGICGYEKILVSCEVKKAKQSGLFKELLSLGVGADNILHFGDNPIADGEACKALGISNVLLSSTLAMAINRGWGKSIQTASSLMERCLLGLILSKIFRDPFQNPNYSDVIHSKQLYRFGICVVAPLAVGHMTWLIQKLQKEKFAGVLFFARDGWLSFNIYKRIQKIFNLPKPIYYYANRKAASLCCMDLLNETERITESGKLMGLKTIDVLKHLFLVPEQKLLPFADGESDMDYIEKHMQWIRQNAFRERKGYLRYSEKCGMLAGESYADVDFFTVGTVQRYLSQFLPYKLKGFFFGCYSPVSLTDDNVDYYLQGNNPLLLGRYVEIEPFFSSPEPSQKCMEETGEPVFDQEQRNERELLDVQTVLHYAERFAGEYFDIFYQEGQLISPGLVEEIYATEDYFVTQQALFDDWFGVSIRQRESVKEEDVL